MQPQDDQYPDYVERALVALSADGRRAGKTVLSEIAHRPVAIPRRKALTQKARAEVFLRDGFVCQYCGGRTIFSGVMEMLALIYPKVFPYAPGWKGGLTHPAFIARSPMVDHVTPIAAGGHPTDPANLVTACNPCNARKGDFTLSQLGWGDRREIRIEGWLGLTDHYFGAWEAAKVKPTDDGAPALAKYHANWMHDLGAIRPDQYARLKQRYGF